MHGCARPPREVRREPAAGDVREGVDVDAVEADEVEEVGGVDPGRLEELLAEGAAELVDVAVELPAGVGDDPADEGVTVRVQPAGRQAEDDVTGDDPLRADRAGVFDWGRRRVRRVLAGRDFGDVDADAIALLAFVEAFGAVPRRPVEVDAALHVVERGFLDPVSFTGSSDIGWFFGLEYLGDPDAEADLVAAQSPMAHVGAVRTPTLVVHSEQDWRCPVEQGQRWFVELRRRGVPSELLLFPGEGHELTRSGRPSHRVARFEHVLRWWDRWLPVGSRSQDAA